MLEQLAPSASTSSCIAESASSVLGPPIASSLAIETTRAFMLLVAFLTQLYDISAMNASCHWYQSLCTIKGKPQAVPSKMAARVKSHDLRFAVHDERCAESFREKIKTGCSGWNATPTVELASKHLLKHEV